MSAFGVNVDEQYFIKTGTYSSKYDFRNAVVKGAEEVRELGEYLDVYKRQEKGAEKFPIFSFLSS